MKNTVITILTLSTCAIIIVALYAISIATAYNLGTHKAPVYNVGSGGQLIVEPK